VKVFLSWSGEKSRRVAALLRDWLPDVINAVEPWMSSEDIEKGSAGLPEIVAQLKECRFGIICLTRENQSRTWINFESGALSKSVGDDPARVATLLVDIAGPSEVTGPLAQFQATKLERADFTRLVLALNNFTDNPRPTESITRVIGSLWGAFEEKLNAALADISSDGELPVRDQREVHDEVLTLVRSISRARTTPPSVSSRAEEILLHHVPQAEGVSITRRGRRWDVSANNADIPEPVQDMLRQDLRILFGTDFDLTLVPF
jgi:hypothetical protein